MINRANFSQNNNLFNKVVTNLKIYNNYSYFNYLDSIYMKLVNIIFLFLKLLKNKIIVLSLFKKIFKYKKNS